MIVYINLPHYLKQFCVKTEDTNIIMKLKSLYGKYCCEKKYPYKTDSFISIEKITKENWRVIIEDMDVLTVSPLQELKNHIFNNNEVESGLFAMHAGGVCLNNTATIFSAATTSGKTTLITYLTEFGLKYISDDCIYVNMNNLDIYPCHNPIHLRKGGLEVLNKMQISPPNILRIMDTYDERFIYVPNHLSPDTMKLDKIYFIERNENLNSVQKLDKILALQKLLLSPIKPYQITMEYLNFLNKLSPHCYNLFYKDLNYVRDLII